MFHYTGKLTQEDSTVQALFQTFSGLSSQCFLNFGLQVNLVLFFMCEIYFLNMC